MNLRSFLFFASLCTAFCAILMVASSILGFWQPSTEIAYICTMPRWVASLCLTDADRGLVIDLSPENGRTSYGISRISWSPDGNRLVFSGSIEGLAGLYLMNVGTGETNLLIEGGETPAWSPDGREIAFSRYNPLTRTSDLFIAELNGNSRLLYDSAGRGLNPAWSPDGTRIVFQEMEWYGRGYSVINIVNTDGSNLRPITYTKSVYFDPAWSPDGTQLALHEGRSRDIILLNMRRGGTQTLTPLLNTRLYGDALYAYNGSPSWSPDGRRIAFDSDTSRGMWQPRGFWVYVMNADGKHTYVIDHGSRPAWRPPRVLGLENLWQDLLN